MKQTLSPWTLPLTYKVWASQDYSIIKTPRVH
jgi:hypothetical protein